MTDDEVMRQLLEGAPPGTAIEADYSARDMERTFIARVNGAPVALGVMDDRSTIVGIGFLSWGFSVDWPAVLRTLPEPEAKRGGS